MIVNVIGLGYIGLPTTLSLASEKIEVIGTDKNESLVNTLNQGRLTFNENGMSELFDEARKHNLRFLNKPVKADVYIIAVPTPYNNITKRIDACYIESAVSDVLSICDKGAIIAIESTVSPGTMDKVVRPLVCKYGFTEPSDIHLAHVPERIIPGNMLYELEHNSRTIGVDTEEVGSILADIYSIFCKGNMVITTTKIAELTKVIENTSRDINIAFANELARICNAEKIDVYEVIKIANMHPRVNILSPGPGVGGHCISVDPWFLVGDYPNIVDIIEAARRVNDDQPKYVLRRISKIMEDYNINSISEVGFYGLTYKENVDDIRESPTLQMLDHMKENLAYGVKVFDPMVKPGIVAGQVENFDEFLVGLKLVVILVGHDHIKNNIDKLSDKIIYDTRNVITGENVIKL